MTSILTQKGVEVLAATRDAAEQAAASCKATQEALANLQLPTAPTSSIWSIFSHDVLLVGGYAALALVLTGLAIYFMKTTPTGAAT